ncbi:zinc-ribbon domain-containing protein [Seohaeicola saemankumensis]|uniref:zinc-ribbon domain-containing protein n=1 Tax=Seohaeicola TaxID=481178 RepID=UPI0035CF3A15
MRLICPNCGAQYEVPQSVIPDTGRDVQCSSCGHTWFQKHPLQDNVPSADSADDDMWEDHETEDRHADEADDQYDFADDDDADLTEDDEPHRDQDVASTEAVPETTEDETAEDEWQGFPTDPGMDDAPTADTRLVPDPEDPLPQFPIVDEDDYEEDPARDLPSPRRTLDTSVADLLREEAEREARARAAERDPGLESQPELGLDAGMTPLRESDAERRAAESRERMARLRGEEPPVAPPAEPRVAPPPPPKISRIEQDDDRIAAAAAAAVADSRRALLPDIEEINSSLSSTSDRRPARADDHEKPGKSADPRNANAAPEKPRGFARGFSLVLLLAALLFALYIFAPALAEAFPAAAPALESYVEAVNGLRVMLDAQFQKLSVWLAQIAGLTG